MPRALLHFLWLLLAVVAGQVHGTIAGGANEGTLAIVSCFIGLQSICGFLNQGGSLINASSITHYAILLFFAFPAIYISLGLRHYEHKTSTESLIIVMVLAGVLQWIILSLCPPRKMPIQRQANYSLSSTTGTISLLLLAVTVALGHDLLGPLQSATGILAAIFAGVSAATAPTGARFAASSSLLAASSLFYALAIFEGFGRLTLGALAIGIAMLGTLRFTGHALKTSILVVTAPAILLLSYHRMDFLQQARGTTISFDEGIGSVVGPFTSAGVIIDRMQDGVIEPSLGTTIFSALVVWIPSSIWSDKPPGFGSEMVPITQPQLANVAEYSDAALLVGEGVWNFGIIGSTLMFVTFAFMVRLLDKELERSASQLSDNSLGPADTCRLVLTILMSSGILNLIWGGWHTYTARLFIPAAILVCFWMTVALLAATKERGRPQATRHTHSPAEPTNRVTT